MSEDPQPVPLDAGTQIPGALDHAWVIESLDQQYTFDENASMWVAQVRCVQCGLRTAFRAADVPPCHPGDRRQAADDRGTAP